MREKIGSFEILRELGRGGMGVVYLGRDTRLDREVAIKVLPEHLASDSSRLARFEREAKTLASLSHPNVAGIYGVEEQDGSKYLVLEFVNGETLADRLDRGPLPVHEAIECAIQISAGMAAAHEAGMIHRDLKPANIMVTPDGVAKVLDFGLAKADPTSSLSGDSAPTATQHQSHHSPTIEGAILGTVGYMSPEQARGRRIDKRTDTWSFGVVLYEMLTGTNPFVGETASDSIGAILHKDFDLSRLPADTPANVRRVLERCLERDPSKRHRDFGDLEIELRREEPASPAQAPPAPPGRRLLGVGAAGIALATVAATVTWFAATRVPLESDRSVRKTDLLQVEWSDRPGSMKPAISPDGKRVAFILDDQVQVRSLDAFEVVPVPGTEGAETVFWSADSRNLGITTDEGIFTLFGLAGRPMPVSELRTQYSQTWTQDGRILASVDGQEFVGIVSIPEMGGEARLALEADPESVVDYHDFAVIPGTNVTVAIQHSINGESPLVAHDGTRTVTIADFPNLFSSGCAWSPTGHVLFTVGVGTLQDLWAVPFSPERMERTGEPFLVMPNVGVPSVANDGTIAVLRGLSDPPTGSELGWVHPDGEFESISAREDPVAFPVASPNGNLLAFAGDITASSADVWVHDFERGFSRRITKDDEVRIPIAWSPDGSEIMILSLNLSGEQGVTTHFHAADGSGETREPIHAFVLGVDRSWKSAATIQWSLVSRDTEKVSVIQLHDPSAVLNTIDTPGLPGLGFGELIRVAISPDGNHMLYESSRSGREEIYCVEWPTGAGLQQVSTEGGKDPNWSTNGSRAIFSSNEDGEFLQADANRNGPLSFSRPRRLFPDGVDSSDLAQLSPTHQEGQLVAVRSSSDEVPRDPYFISIIENWHESFREHESGRAP